MHSYSRKIERLVTERGSATGSCERGSTSDFWLEYRYCACVMKSNLLRMCYQGGKISVNKRGEITHSNGGCVATYARRRFIARMVQRWGSLPQWKRPGMSDYRKRRPYSLRQNHTEGEITGIGVATLSSTRAVAMCQLSGRLRARHARHWKHGHWGISHIHLTFVHPPAVPFSGYNVHCPVHV